MNFVAAATSTVTALACFVALWVALLHPQQTAPRLARRSLLAVPEDSQHLDIAASSTFDASGLPKCALYHELPANHDDVMAGIAYAFQKAGCLLDVFQKADNYSIQEVMLPWFSGYFKPFESFPQLQPGYSLVIFVTFGRKGDEQEPDSAYSMLSAVAEVAASSQGASNSVSIQAGFTPGADAHQRTQQQHEMQGPLQQHGQRQQQQQQYLGLVHNPAHLNSPRMQRLLRALGPRLRLATISTSVAQAAQQVIRQVKLGPRVPWEVPYLSPVFPLPPDTEALVQQLAAGNVPPSNLCIQGAIFKARRNYNDVFQAARVVGARLRAGNESLLLVGAKVSRLEVPADVQALIREAPGLPYKAGQGGEGYGVQDFFELLTQCRALVTAFASDEYFTIKASSTIATALNLGVPLLTEARTRPAYSFLPPGGLLEHASPGKRDYGATYARALRAAFEPRGAERRAMLLAKEEMLGRNVEVARALLGAGAGSRL
ncbi:hypothetical protein N2152v2_003951 [Parachlorella kessleri]